MTELSDLTNFIRELREAPWFDQMTWAEEEIELAQRRHQEKGDGPIRKAFTLLRPAVQHAGMARRPIFQAHCRELLDRVANGQDTRPATDVEIMLALSEASMVTPFNSAGATLYFRMADRTAPHFFARVLNEIDLDAYEKLHGARADDLEREMRWKLRQEWRKGEAK